MKSYDITSRSDCDKDQISRDETPVEVCIKCDAKKVNNVWYYRGVVPTHKPLYKHTVCPECGRKNGTKSST